MFRRCHARMRAAVGLQSHPSALPDDPYGLFLARLYPIVVIRPATPRRGLPRRRPGARSASSRSRPAPPAAPRPPPSTAARGFGRCIGKRSGRGHGVAQAWPDQRLQTPPCGCKSHRRFGTPIPATLRARRRVSMRYAGCIQRVTPALAGTSDSGCVRTSCADGSRTAETRRRQRSYEMTTLGLCWYGADRFVSTSANGGSTPPSSIKISSVPCISRRAFEVSCPYLSFRVSWLVYSPAVLSPSSWRVTMPGYCYALASCSRDADLARSFTRKRTPSRNDAP